MTLNYAEAIYALDDSDLDVYQSRVWLRVLRRGVCFESQRNMADGMKISLGKVNQALQWLLENGWIVRQVDERTKKMGYVAVIPREQTQQNSVSPHERDVLPHERDVLPHERDVLPHERDVLPHERHLKAKEIKQKTHTAREEMPADAPPMYSGMAYEHPPTGKALEYQHQIDEMVAALATVTGMDLGLNKDKLEGDAIALLENEYTPEQVTTGFYGSGSYWRLMCYGGKKGDTPKLGNIRNEIARAVKWDGRVPSEPNGNGRSQHNQTTPPPAIKQPTQAEIDALQAMISRGLA